MVNTRNYTPLQRRALNMVWTAAGRYDFEPMFLAFLPDGQPDFYMNSVIGYVYKWLDVTIITQLFDSFSDATLRDVYDGLLWVALENCVYEKELPYRPVLSELRISCAKLFFEQEQIKTRAQWLMQSSLVYTMQSARWKKVLGKTFLLSPRKKKLFAELSFDGSMDTNAIRERILDIYGRYFHFRLKKKLPSFTLRLNSVFTKFLPSRLERNEVFTLGRDIKEENIRMYKPVHEREFSLPGEEERIRSYIEDCFGKPLYSPSESAQLEHLLCTDNHFYCHIYFTAGEKNATPSKEPQIARAIEEASAQKERNETYFSAHRSQYETAIHKLSQQIRNATLVHAQAAQFKCKRGQLNAAWVWRSVFLDDDAVFLNHIETVKPEFSVDLMLDASASRLRQQETIAAQGYVIAKSLQLCNIPVQVYSFLSLNGYTILNLLCDYQEKQKTNRIFQYHAAGWNRDGLAFRGAGALMEHAPCAHRILIVLTDASPNDDKKLPADKAQNRLLNEDYSGTAAVTDTAEEVKKLKQQGIRVIGILTGEHKDIAAAKKIYGTDWVHIQDISQFSNAVGALMLKQILNLYES